jgi:hypothetical protein
MINPQEFLSDVKDLFDFEVHSAADAEYFDPLIFQHKQKKLQKLEIFPTGGDTNALFFYISVFKSRSVYSKSKIIQNIEISSSSSVKNLLDLLHCPSSSIDILIDGRVVEYVDFVFIEGSFYCASKDELSPIQTWWDQINKHDEIGKFKINPIDTKLLDIEITLKKPYLMVHKGDCGHVFTVDDIKVTHSTKPRSIILEKIKLHSCAGCDRLPTLCLLEHREEFNGGLFCRDCFDDFFGVDSNVPHVNIQTNCDFLYPPILE